MRRFDPQRRATLHTPCTNTAYIPRKHPANTLQIHTAHTPQPLTRNPSYPAKPLYGPVKVKHNLSCFHTLCRTAQKLHNEFISSDIPAHFPAENISGQTDCENR